MEYYNLIGVGTMKKILTIIFCLLFLIVSGCNCDLSHKHYYNDRGVCNCGKDIAESLTYLNEEYKSSSSLVKEGETYYYKFVAHGENGVDLILDSESVIFDRVEIRADGVLQTIALSKDYSYKVYMYDDNLYNERVYYLKVTYKGEGNISLIIKEIS